MDDETRPTATAAGMPGTAGTGALNNTANFTNLNNPNAPLGAGPPHAIPSFQLSLVQCDANAIASDVDDDLSSPSLSLSLFLDSLLRESATDQPRTRFRPIFPTYPPASRIYGRFPPTAESQFGSATDKHTAYDDT